MKIKFHSAAITLVVINCIVFFFQMLLGRGFTESFLLISTDVFTRPWILITSMFLHANPNHLFFNMYSLFMFGPLIEQKIGRRRFLFIYFFSGFMASLVSTFFYPAALGASGALMGIIGVTIMLLPHLQVLFFFFIPMSLRTAGVIIALIDIFGIFVPTGIANIAHLIGLGCGLFYGYYLLKQKQNFTTRFQRVHDHKPKMSYRFNTTIELDKDDIEDYLKYGKL